MAYICEVCLGSGLVGVSARGHEYDPDPRWHDDVGCDECGGSGEVDRPIQDTEAWRLCTLPAFIAEAVAEEGFESSAWGGAADAIRRGDRTELGRLVFELVARYANKVACTKADERGCSVAEAVTGLTWVYSDDKIMRGNTDLEEAA